MTSESHETRRQDGSKTPDVLITENSDAAEEVTAITLGGFLKFTLFFVACLALAVLLLAWCLGYFHQTVTR